MKLIISSSSLSSYLLTMVVLFLVLQLEGVTKKKCCMAEAAMMTCKAVELSPCAVAIVSSKPPSAVCCKKIKQQRPCMCQYLKDPNLKKFVNSPNARKVALICGTPYPRC